MYFPPAGKASGLAGIPVIRPVVASGKRCQWLRLLSVAVISGCATFEPIEKPLDVYSGRFSASISRESQREAMSGRFTLARFARRTTLDLATPLGNTLARIEASDNGAMLTAPQSDGTLATWAGESADALAETVLGFRLPVSGLADWITGRAAPGRPASQMPASGAPHRIEQDGWVIVIEERFEDTGSPRRLSFDRDPGTPSGASLRLRLVLDPVNNTAGHPPRQ